ncbi:MAG: 3-dehydroquinate synthase family protein [Actinomycetota bacterium]
MSGFIVEHVDLGDRSYDVHVGAGAIQALPEVLPPVERVAVVTQAEIPVEVDPGTEHRVFTIGQGESAKSLDSIGELCSAFARWGLSRGDCVVGVGGGLVTDVAGFAAAVYHRGVPVVQVPTTLLGQIDAAIGGKTGVNLAEGKNLVGAFWQPAAVICDTDTLGSLPEREWRSGLGELAKYAFLGAEADGTKLEDLPLPERVARCVRLKADVVSGDEREGGRRALLNYGHTLGHALEIAGRFDLRHGEAVAIGLVFAAELARVLERIDVDRVERHRDVLTAMGLSYDLPDDADPDELIELMGRDKKAVGSLTFILDGPDGPEVVPGIDPADLRRAFAAMGAP